MTERTAGDILEKRFIGENLSSLAQNIKSALDALGEISTNLETTKNGNSDLSAVVDESLLGVREVRSRVLGRVPQVLWVSADDPGPRLEKCEAKNINEVVVPEGYMTLAQMWQELGINEGAWLRVQRTYVLPFVKVGLRKYFDKEKVLVLKNVIDAEKTKPKEKRESKIASPVKLEEKDMEERNEYGVEDGLSLNIYYDDVRKTNFNTARNKIYARNILRGEYALIQLEKILESGIITGDIAKEVATLLTQPKAKHLLLNMKNTIKSSREADKNKNQGSYLTAKSATRQEKWISKKIENISHGGYGEMETIIANRIKTAKAALVSFDSLVGENLKLVAKRANMFKGKGLPIADLISLGNEGLLTAAAKYNYKTGYAFSTYAFWWIRQRISRGIIETGQAIRLPVHAHETLSEITRVQKDLTQTFGYEPTGLEVARKVGISISNYRSIMNVRNIDSLNKIIGRSEDMELEDKVARVEVDYDGGASRAELREVVENALEYLSKRERRVIEIRFGIGQNQRSQTLNAVGKELGVSRERARQIEDGALRKLNRLLRTYVLDLRSNLLQNRRAFREKSEVGDTRDIRAIKGLETLDSKQLAVDVKVKDLSAAEEVGASKIREVAKEPLQMNSECNITEYCKPGEIISILGISRQRWHQIKGVYRYKSIKIGKIEHILREDLMAIKSSYVKTRYRTCR